MGAALHSPNQEVLRSTRSVCPICRVQIAAQLVMRSDKVYLVKSCTTHGDCTVEMGYDSEYFSDLLDAYFSIVPPHMPQKILEIAITSRCGFNCPICSSKTVRSGVADLSVDEVLEVVRSNMSKEIMLWGLEATDHPNLKEIITGICRLGKSPYLFTNGYKLADEKYLDELRAAGLTHVHMQFDGFDDRIYEKLRGQRLLDNKLKAFANLQKCRIATCLNVTLAKGVNEGQIPVIIKYCIQNDFIKQIGFLPLIKVGSAQGCSNDMVPLLHETLAIIERETGGRIKVNSVRIFQKLMYVIYRFTKFRRCFWFTIFVLIKDARRNDYLTLDQIIDFSKLDQVVSTYISRTKRKASLFNDVRLIISLLPLFMRRKLLPLVAGFMVFALLGNSIRTLRLGRNVLWLTCVDFCDPYKMDLDMAEQYCEETLAYKKDGRVVFGTTYDEALGIRSAPRKEPMS